MVSSSAAFYSDSSCTKDATIDFSTTNPGCFSVGDREYVKYHNLGPCFSLVKSPGPDCTCQYDCMEGGAIQTTPNIGDCLPTSTPPKGCIHVGKSESLRFIGGHCARNNCPDTSAKRDISNSFSGHELIRSHLDQDIERNSMPKSNHSTLSQRDYGRPGLGWYRLCEDKYCTQNCSINFRTSNPNCYGGANYNSIEFGGDRGANSGLSLVATLGEGCSCQTDCQTFEGGRSCYQLNPGVNNRGSYRMITESCSSNNC